MKGLDDGHDGLNDEAFDRALGVTPRRSRAIVVFGLQDGQYTAGTALLLRRIKALGATVKVAKTGRVTVVTVSGDRRVYALELDRQLVDASRSGNPSADTLARLRSADSPLSRALRDLEVSP